MFCGIDDASLQDRLTALRVKKLAEPGMHHDGGGLYLIVQPTGGKSWIYRYMLKGRAREMGLGPAHSVSLIEAREMARQARRTKLAGIDPIDQRQGKQARPQPQASEAFTFKQAARAYIHVSKAGWRNDKHAMQWESTLDARDVLVIDEAGMIGSRQMERLLSAAEKVGAKVVLVGDPEQLQAIEAGAAFRSIAERHSHVEITQVRRQHEDWQRDATRQLATGRTGETLASYEVRGIVHSAETREQARDDLLER
jgi:hypothetical protein